MSGPRTKRNLLFTPGPLTTTAAVKESMLEDLGSRDSVFIAKVKAIRDGMLRVADLAPAEWTCIPVQGSGTMGVEAAVSTMAPRDPAAKMLVLRTGSYSERMFSLAQRLGIAVFSHDTEEASEIDLVALEKLLAGSASAGVRIATVGFVHHETGTGKLNPIEAISALVRRYFPTATIIIDAMSSFGGIPIDVKTVCDVLVTSANKCIHGVPGFSIVLARRALLQRTAGNSRSFTLDLFAQNDGLDKTGQFSYTPPVHILVAFHQALTEFESQGGVAGRVKQYQENSRIIITGMTALGYKLFLNPNLPSFGHFIVGFHWPKHAKWDFEVFYKQLQKRGFVIYPGKASKAPTFRIGCIGDLHAADMRALLVAAQASHKEMGITSLTAAKL